MSNTSTASKSPIFVPKQDSSVVHVTVDEALQRIAEIRAKMAPLEAQEKNLIEVVKSMMKENGETKHTTSAGITASFVTSQRGEVNKALAKELLGPKWAEVESFKTVTSFTVKVPGQ